MGGCEDEGEASGRWPRATCKRTDLGRLERAAGVLHDLVGLEALHQDRGDVRGASRLVGVDEVKAERRAADKADLLALVQRRECREEDELGLGRCLGGGGGGGIGRRVIRAIVIRRRAGAVKADVDLVRLHVKQAHLLDLELPRQLGALERGACFPKSSAQHALVSANEAFGRVRKNAES